MGLQYINADEKDFSLGIDARSAENQIAPGFVRDLLNADIVEKRVRKRPGYQGFAGNVPVRVTAMEYLDSTNQICFTLDSAISFDDTAIDLNSIRSTPIVVYGRSSSITSGGPFTTAADTVRYYPGISVPTRKVFLETAGAPPYETLNIPGTEHGFGTTDLFATVVESTSTIDKSYQKALSHDIAVDASSFDLDIQYQNSTGADTNVFAYYSDKTAVVGQTYIQALNHTGSGSESFTISAATHALNNFNIVAQIQEDRTTSYARVQAESFIVENDGDVVITLNASAVTTFYTILSAAPISNQESGNVAGLSTGTVVLTGLTSPWIFYGVYLELTPGGDKELVYPDSIEYNDATQQAVLTFTNQSSSARNFVVFYEYGVIRSNQLCVTNASVSVNAIDDRPQLTIWGLDHNEIYGTNKSGRAGWINHIDSYRSAGEQRVVAGLGGNLFTARTYDEVGTSHDFAKLYPNLQARTATATIRGPLFWDTGDTPARTRGYITADNSGTNWAEITSIQYDTGNGWTKYSISLPNKAILDSTGTPTTLGSVISTTSGLEDWLTVSDMSYSRHNGTFKIQQVLNDTDMIHVWVENDNNSSDYDDAHTGGQAAVFTDQFIWLASAPFIPGDSISSAALGDTFVCTVMSSSGTTTVTDGFIEKVGIAGGLFTSGTRQSSVIPLRSSQPSSVSSTTNMVRGDMLSYTGIDRLLRVKSVNSDSSRTIDISSSSGTATATMASGDTTFLSEGNTVLITQAGVYTGAQIVTSILSSNQFQFSSDETVSVTGAILQGSTIEIDESLTWSDSSSDSNVFRTEQRWIPVEAPDDQYNLTPSTYVRQLDSNSYSDQSFLRSAMVVDNMYLTDYSDEVYKFDGTNIYRAGLFPWQPGLFITQDTAPTAKLVADNPTATPSAVVDNVFTLPLGDEQKFPVGTRIRHSFTGGFNDYDVLSTYDNNSNGFVKVRRTSTSSIVLGASPLLTLLSTLRYYFRLNAVDANDNIIASAVTGYQDHVVELAVDAAINLKLVGMPAWDVYDYDRLEVEIYRTRINQPAPFYKITTIQMDFDRGQGYINYTDTFVDTDLIDLDVVNTALKGAELGTAWQEPLRSKYVTSIGNSLVLGNVKDYPQLDIQIVASGAVSNTQFAGKILTFRKDNTDSGSTTNMVDRARYEFVQTSTSTSVSAAVGVLNTSFQITVANTAAAGDWVYLFWSTVATSGRSLKYAGWWQIASATATDIVINFPDADAGNIAAVTPDEALFATDPTDIPVPIGVDGNMGMVNGDSFDLFDTMRRMSMAINATMRMVDISITGYSTFVPWMVSRGGNDVGRAGRLVVRQPRADSTTLEVQLPSSFSASGLSFQMFVNELRRVVSEQVSASTRIYPSRVLVSYENYPELFDNPTSVLAEESESAIDINSADGQEITGILPFFGEAAFGAAQQSGILVVFKTNSIYLVDINEKRAGRNPVQRIETEGLGCTAPYSIATTKNGIIFANESGIYCLRRNQAIDYIGRYMERNWTERVNLDLLSIAQGHHYGVGRVYKLSIPLVDEEESSEAYVYNHTGESEGRGGAWSRYDNHPATGWCNLASNAFFGATSGRVFSLRNTGTETDYRDDSEAINFQLDTRAIDFGNSGIRKVVDKVLVNYRTMVRNASTALLYAIDMLTEYSESTDFILAKPVESTGLDDRPSKDIEQIAHSIDRRRGNYFQFRITNAAIDENIEVAGMDFRVGGLSSKGMRQAKETETA